MRCPECSADVLDVSPADKSSKTLKCPQCGLTSTIDRWGERKDSSSKPRKKTKPIVQKKPNQTGTFNDLLARIIAAGLLWIGLVGGAACLVQLLLIIGNKGYEENSFESHLYAAGIIQSLMLAGAGIIVDRVCKIAARL